MPSRLHEALIFLFRNRPTLAPELLQDALHVELPSYTEARIDSAELTEVQPPNKPLYHALKAQPWCKPRIVHTG